MTVHRTRHFDDCFPASCRSSREFLMYIDVLSRGSAKRSVERPELHHIVPREWLSGNVDGFGRDAEDISNMTYLSTRDRVVALQCLLVLFKDMGDSRTYSRLAKAVSRRYGIPYGRLWSDPYLTRDMVDCMSERRDSEFERMQRRGRPPRSLEK